MKPTPLLAIATALVMTAGSFFLNAQSGHNTALGIDLSGSDVDKKAAVDDEPLPEPKSVAMLFEWIEVDHRVANKLLQKHTDLARANSLRNVLEEMLDEGTAELLDTSFINTIPDVRSRISSERELIYVTSADPPEIPQTFKGKLEGDVFPITPASPTAFDYRNVGTLIEVETSLRSRGRIIEARIAPEVVRYLGKSFMGQDRAPSNLQSHILQPKFYKIGSPSSLALVHGQHALGGVFTPEGDTDRRILLMVRANTLF